MNQKKNERQRSSAVFMSNVALEEFSHKLLSNNDVLAQRIQKSVKTLSEESRFKKAQRHIYDAYYLRTVRNDIDREDKTIIKYLWYLDNNGAWSMVLFILIVVYQIITFFESPFPEDEQKNNNLITIETIILVFIGIDCVITLILEITQSSNLLKFNAKKHLKVLIYLICLIDFLINLFDHQSIRYSRICRTLLMPMFSKDLRRNLKGIMKASRDLCILVILYIIIISLFAFIGINLIGKLDNVDQRTQDYGDFFKFFSMLFMVATLDFYPDILIPPMIQGMFYALFFIFYLLLFLFIFAPIPLAVVYEGFRNHRMEIAISDIIKQKSAMMASFISLDQEDKGFLTKQQFQSFLERFYCSSPLKQDQLDIIFALIDQDFNDKVQFDEFYKFLHLLQGKQIGIPKVKPLKLWQCIRLFLNEKGLNKLIESQLFGIIMILTTLINCSFIISAFFIDDQNILDIFSLLDILFLIIYCLECLLKIIALGFDGYFADSWNIFDFSLVCLQIVFDYILFNIVSGNISQSIKANRILRLAKIQKVFRLFRALRSIKFLNWLFSGLEIIENVRILLYKIIVCVPVIFRLLLPIQIIFFIYSCVGMYMYGQIIKDPNNPYSNSKCNSDELYYQWGNCEYADFSTFAGSYMMMLQMFIAAQWSQVVFEITYDTDNMLSAVLFIGSFQFISIFLLALIGGLVWEVFSIVSLSMKQNEEQVEQTNKDEELLNQINNKFKEQNITQLKRRTLLLNDDNPDIIKVQPKQRQQKKSKSCEKVYQPPPRISSEELIVNDERPELNISQPNSRCQLVKKTINFKLNNNNQQLDIIEYYKIHFIDYSQYLELKIVNGLNVNQITIEYVNHLRNEIKKEEILQKQNINISNHQMLIQSAVLKDASEFYIKQQEEKFFTNSFGKKFQKIKELKFQSKFKIESKIIFSLMGILKFPKPNLKYYFQILYLIESQFTYQLLSDSSFFKLIHQINNKWYTIHIQDGEIIFNKLHNGPWEYTDQLFNNSDIKICENLEKLSETANQTYLSTLDSFQTSVKEIAKQFDIKMSTFDMSCILCQIKNLKSQSPTPKDTQSFRPNQNYTNETSPNQYISIESQKLIGQRLNNPLQQQSLQFDELKQVNKSMIIVFAKTAAQEQRIAYQNLVMLTQFILDIAGVIHNYSTNYFQQIEDLFQLRQQLQ